MKTIETNLSIIIADGMTNAGTKMALAMKEEMRRYNYQIIATDLLDAWLAELRAKQEALRTEHPQWKPLAIDLCGIGRGNTRWLCLNGEAVARVVKPRGEIVRNKK